VLSSNLPEVDNKNFLTVIRKYLRNRDKKFHLFEATFKYKDLQAFETVIIEYELNFDNYFERLNFRLAISGNALAEF
jgi:hypothetical protein